MPTRVRRFILLVAALAAAVLALSFHLWPPALTPDWWLVFATLLALSLLSELLAIPVTEQGTVVIMDYVPQLGAVVLLGAPGAGLLTLLSTTIYQVFFTDKPSQKVVFNVGQYTLAVSAAGFTYTILGGSPSLSSFAFAASLFPFTAAVIINFVVNNLSVTYIVSLAEEQPFLGAWKKISFTPIAFDIAASFLGFLAAYLYIRWGLAALLAIILPVIGLRYVNRVALELKQLSSDLLRVLIKTIEAQDPYTSGHSLRVAENAITIAERMGLNAKEVEKIETAALLHDIGKIDNKYRNILRQQGSLTDKQWQTMRQHPERGVEIVESVRSLDPDVLAYIKYHHERYDGDGYPEGLAGEEIPLGARIIMVADTVDAMVRSRPYRDALPPDRVEEELIEHAGTQFDPEVVQAALEVDIIN